MPLMRIDAVEGRTEEEIAAVLDAVHRAMLAAFKVPARDRYQIYQEHKQAHFIMQDTGLGFERTRNFLMVNVVSRPRSAQLKQAFYKLLCEELKQSCQIEPSDVMVSIVSNTDDDWSFGNGMAQFITGDL